jgi:acylphosphatase
VQARRILVSGRVQGVAFRATTQERARTLGLVGWVRNLTDGGVEVVAQGEESALDELVAWCHRGPRAARVDEVRTTAHPVDPAWQDFTVGGPDRGW